MSEKEIDRVATRISGITIGTCVGSCFSFIAVLFGGWLVFGLLSGIPTPPSAQASTTPPASSNGGVTTGAANSGSPLTPAPNPPSDLLAYEKEVAAENKDHEQFIERMDTTFEDHAIKLGAAALAIIAGIFTWFEVQTRRSLRKSIQSKIKAMIDVEVMAELSKLRENMQVSFQQILDSDLVQYHQQMEVTFTEEGNRLRRLIHAGMARQSQIHDIVSESLIQLRTVARGNPTLEEQRSIERTFEKVKRNWNVTPQSRALAIQAARFYAEYLKDVTTAITILEESLKKREETRQKENTARNAETGMDEDDAALFITWPVTKMCCQNALLRIKAAIIPKKSTSF